MYNRKLGIITFLTALTTILWLGLTIVEVVRVGTASSLEERVAAIENGQVLFFLSYINAALITLLCMATLSGLADCFEREDPLWLGLARACLPIYGTINLCVYLSQVFVVPGLIGLYHQPETRDIAQVLLGLGIHAWRGSAVEFVNGLAYAVLGISSITLGARVARRLTGQKISGWLLALSGGLSFLALIGLGIHSEPLAFLSLISGVVFLFALVLLAKGFLTGLTG